MTKERARQYFLSQIRAISPQEKQKQSRKLCTGLWSWWNSKGKPSLWAFWPLASEPDIRPFLLQVLCSKGMIALPRIVGQRLVFHQVTYLDCHLSHHSWNLKKPLELAPLWEVQEGLILVPGLGFDQQGGRLGRGKGFYDRYLQTLPQEIIRIGIGFSVQFLPKLVVESHDQRMDGWFSSRGLTLAI